MKQKKESLRIQVVGPYRAATINEVFENIMRARNFAVQIARLGHYPFTPHLNTMLMDGVQDDSHWLKMGLDTLKWMDGIFIMPKSGQSQGAKAEIREARQLGLRMFYQIDDIPNLSDGRQ